MNAKSRDREKPRRGPEDSRRGGAGGEHPGTDDPHEQLARLGEFIRTQRTLAGLSLRQLADRTDVSNPYLSQIERGLHEPSVRVIRSIASALDVSATRLLDEAGLLEDVPEADGAAGETGTLQQSTEAAIRTDPLLEPGQKEALLAVYRSYVRSNDTTDD